MLLVLAWLRSLVTPSETPLKALETDDITAEGIYRALQRVERRMVELDLEWGEMLDKLTRVAARENARKKARAKRDLEVEEEEEEFIMRPPTVERQPPPPSIDLNGETMAFDPRDKASIRRYLHNKRA